ncbi:LysR family transcriptional regulator [Rhizobium bangladeshense]|uniref:LysR family transcriptional regulator n=1 Tax=Rhizobium bangladeshense TaxID=1138189 RepID=UPI001A99AEEA|nr:LysR family transcriptional regulator [Rhizobium bangladeshense]MBX4897062.1 LysR family transcriptional regulator [Rhizobium bangladeshense]MBX4915607.1 LysR family transcriptional regulator [Rhizobium bangladeshense]MBX4920472.1 LysR family transcriptional regulator [Rhizobium bangladeshense]MBX4934732.1 LysR family transcriptional regulator [Rhizobium bangladeshense]MBY3582766.1 LysR family transcriptional regulator [Rhizobium bangladeshense]
MKFDSRLLSGIGVVSAVVEAGSFARAGESMGLTQPAISRAVARLEERVGIRIFNRTARAISLTDEGRSFYEAVAPLLAGIEDAAVRAGGSRTLVRGRLRINVDGTFGHHLLAPRIGEFLQGFPELTVDVSVRDRMGDLVGDGFDIAVRFGEPETSSLKARLLLRTRVMTCASPSYIARYGEPKKPRDLRSGHRCLLIRNDATGRPYEWEFRRGERVVPVPVTGSLIVNDTGSLLGACLGGAGVAQLLELYAKDIIAQGRLVPLLPDWSDETFPLYAYHHASHIVPAKVQAFLEFVREITG